MKYKTIQMDLKLFNWHFIFLGLASALLQDMPALLTIHEIQSYFTPLMHTYYNKYFSDITSFLNNFLLSCSTSHGWLLSDHKVAISSQFEASRRYLGIMLTSNDDQVFDCF